MVGALWVARMWLLVVLCGLSSLWVASALVREAPARIRGATGLGGGGAAAGGARAGRAAWFDLCLLILARMWF
jgi:hypothetical protein